MGGEATSPRALGLGPVAFLVSGALVLALTLPLAALALATSATDLQAALRHPQFWPALSLSLRTTLGSLVVTVVAGTPLAWWLATAHSRLARLVELAVELPIVIPPAVMGVALLQTFGHRGILGSVLERAGARLSFSENAVLMAQVVVSAPFFVQAASNAFRKIDLDMLTVARTLGAPPAVAFFRVAFPIAAPGLAVGASLSWARSLGEFGATLLFAGNMTGITQTMPLAIFTVLESDVRLAVVFALVLAVMGAGLLLVLRVSPSLLGSSSGGARTRLSRST